MPTTTTFETHSHTEISYTTPPNKSENLEPQHYLYLQHI